jgi:hypothetical protein
MRECIFCGSKSITFFVSDKEQYICPKHYYMAKEVFGEDAIKSFSKNKIVIKGKIAVMTLYNKQFNKKEEVIIDAEDIELVREIRWHLANNGEVITDIVPQRIRISKKTGKIIRQHLKLCDYIMFHRFGITTPVYYVNNNPLDCRKVNLRIARDRKSEKSSIKYILGRGENND